MESQANSQLSIVPFLTISSTSVSPKAPRVVSANDPPLATPLPAPEVKRYYRGPPYHKFFHLFGSLPPELQIAIWALSVKPRIVELLFSYKRGFYSRVITPTVLRVSKVSREAVLSKYPLCFGNNLYEPRVRFNFSIDTLLIPQSLQHHTTVLFASFTKVELKGLRYIAMSSDINEDYDLGGTPVDSLDLFKKMVPKLPALYEFNLVLDLADWGHYGQPSGSGRMHLYTEWPEDLLEMHECCDCCNHVEEDEDPNYPSLTTEECADQCEYHQYPDFSDEFAGIDIPSTGCIWGWRPFE